MPINTLPTRIIKIYNHFHKRLQHNLALTAIRQGLLYLIPLLLIGSLALVCASLPIPAYQRLMEQWFGLDWQLVLVSIHDGTFGILAILMLLSISYAFAAEYNARRGLSSNPLIVCVVSLGSFVGLTGLTARDGALTEFGAMGVFLAMVTSIAASLLFLQLSSVRLLTLPSLRQGVNAIYNDALSSLLPAACTIGFFAALNATMATWWDIHSISLLLSDTLVWIFSRIQSPEIGAYLFVLLVHALWLFGIHGNHVLEPVARQLFAPCLADNHEVLSAGLGAADIFSRSFLDAFVLMGGCGSALSLVLAILLFGRQKTDRSIVKLSLVPVVFNMNELLLFGVPIVLNPVYAIPFVAAPLVVAFISYHAIAAGWVPATISYVEWTTPLFLSGFAATGSIKGSLLQLINLLVGTLIYVPFVRWSEFLAKDRMKSSLEHLYTYFKSCEQQGAGSLLTRPDETGVLARRLADDLKQDLLHEKLTLFYQPQVNAQKQVFGMEALLRWRHQQFGFLYPPLVVALAEEAGLMDKLGYWVTDTACGELKRLEASGHSGLTMSVNVAGSQLENKAFIRELDGLLSKHQLSPDRLEIEMTEQIALTSGERIMHQIKALKSMGVKLAMDDFGMGRSSLMYLKEYEFDTVKLDGSLVREILTNHNCQEIISSIVFLSTSLGFAVLAEFVEEDAQADVLQEIGCTRYQGYLYSKPLSSAELSAYLQRSDIDAASA